jgi:hypothetical protein
LACKIIEEAVSKVPMTKETGHSEFISESGIKCVKILKQVQDD